MITRASFDAEVKQKEAMEKKVLEQQVLFKWQVEEAVTDRQRLNNENEAMRREERERLLYVPRAAVRVDKQPTWGEYLYKVPIELDTRFILIVMIIRSLTSRLMTLSSMWVLI